MFDFIYKGLIVYGILRAIWFAFILILILGVIIFAFTVAFKTEVDQHSSPSTYALTSFAAVVALLLWAFAQFIDYKTYKGLIKLYKEV